MSAFISELLSEPLKLVAALDVAILALTGLLIADCFCLVISVCFYLRAKAKTKKLPAYLRTY